MVVMLVYPNLTLYQMLRIAFKKSGQVVRKAMVHKNFDLMDPNIVFPVKVKVKKSFYYKPDRKVNVLQTYNKPSLQLLSGN